MRKTLLVIWAFITLLVYSSILISPQHFEYVGLFGFGIPFLILFNICFLLVAWIGDWKTKWGAIVLVLLSVPFFPFGPRISGNSDMNQEGLKVMSYNVKWFVDAREQSYQPVIDWLKANEADVMCFQEFYPLKNIQERLGEGYYVSSDSKEFHTAIFSKYPIVNEGLLLEKDRLNNIRFVDIRKNKDTLRIYNLHLQSTGIQPEKINASSATQSEYERLGIRFVSASRVRSSQMDVLINHMEKSPYPSIVVGDFNDVPFSNNYYKLRKRMNNAFEKQGSGMGATFNNKIPYLRIDNQFYSNEFELKGFKTFNEIYFSDHFPLIGIYDLSR